MEGLIADLKPAESCSLQHHGRAGLVQREDHTVDYMCSLVVASHILGTAPFTVTSSIAGTPATFLKEINRC